MLNVIDEFARVATGVNYSIDADGVGAVPNAWPFLRGGPHYTRFDNASPA